MKNCCENQLKACTVSAIISIRHACQNLFVSKNTAFKFVIFIGATKN